MATQYWINVSGVIKDDQALTEIKKWLAGETPYTEPNLCADVFETAEWLDFETREGSDRVHLTTKNEQEWCSEDEAEELAEVLAPFMRTLLITSENSEDQSRTAYGLRRGITAVEVVPLTAHWLSPEGESFGEVNFSG